MAVKAKNSKKQQQAVATTMVTPNFFMVPNEILDNISTAAVSTLFNMDGNSNDLTSNIKQDQLLAVLSDVVISRFSPAMEAKQFIISDNLKDWTDQIEIKLSTPFPVSGVANGNTWVNVNGRQKSSGWVASTLVPNVTFKIKMALLSSLFQFLPENLTGATKVAIGNKVFLTTLKIAQSSGVASVSSSFLLIALHDISLGTSSDDIKSALGIFGVVTSVKLKPAGLWQYAVVHFKDISFAAAALTYWSVLVNQREIITLKDAFKAKLINLLFGCTAFEISDLVSQIGGCTCFISHSPKFYAKAAAIVIPPVVAAANTNLNLGARLASLKSHLSELSLLIKSLVEPVGALVVLVTKLLSIPSAIDVLIKKSVAEFAEQNKDLAVVAIIMQKKITCLEKKCEWACLEDAKKQ
ncbi:hypothetical protein G9A89_011702 [Geosiphon pyriformis]|nr:hypothetical protein G9A89_011702 [Geosiphon pyriformis]